jgi:hypothetical protein
MLLVQPPCFSSAANQQRQLLNYFEEGFVIFCIFSVPTMAKIVDLFKNGGKGAVMDRQKMRAAVKTTTVGVVTTKIGD